MRVTETRVSVRAASVLGRHVFGDAGQEDGAERWLDGARRGVAVP